MTNITTERWIDGSTTTERVPAASELNLKREFAGHYETADGEWTIQDIEGRGWIGRSNTDRFVYTDFMYSFADAKVWLASKLGIETLISKTPARWEIKYDENHKPYRVAI